MKNKVSFITILLITTVIGFIQQSCKFTGASERQDELI